MKKSIYLFVLVILTISCKVKQGSFNIESKDIIVFNFNNDNVFIIENNGNVSIIKDGNYIITSQNWANYGSKYFIKTYDFVLNGDTMSIKCFCGQERNYFFNNLKFKKGNYELKINYEMKNDLQAAKYFHQVNYIFGKEIGTSKATQNILFNNTYVSQEVPPRANRLMKDLEFVLKNLNDTINISFIEIR